MRIFLHQNKQKYALLKAHSEPKPNDLTARLVYYYLSEQCKHNHRVLGHKVVEVVHQPESLQYHEL